MKFSNDSGDIFSNSNTLLVFMYLKSQNPNSLGLREIMRATKIKSSSTVSRQLEKLEKAGLIKKDGSNKYKITESGLSIKKFDVHITIPVSLTGRFLFTFLIFQLSFGLMMVLFSFIILWVDVLLSAIISLAGLIVGLIFIVFRWIQIRKQLQIYHFFSKKS